MDAPVEGPAEAQGPTLDPATVEAVLGVVALIRTLFGDALAAAVEADAARIGRELGGRWDCYRAAIWTTSRIKRKPERFLPYLMAGARKNARQGIDPEASAIEAEYWARVRAAEAARRPPPVAAAVEAEAPLSLEESRDHWTKLLKSTSRSLRELAERNLAKLEANPEAGP